MTGPCTLLLTLLTLLLPLRLLLTLLLLSWPLLTLMLLTVAVVLTGEAMMPTAEVTGLACEVRSPGGRCRCAKCRRLRIIENRRISKSSIIHSGPRRAGQGVVLNVAGRILLLRMPLSVLLL